MIFNREPYTRKRSHVSQGFKAAKPFIINLNVMKKDIEIPKGCTKLQIDIEGGCMTVYYESKINDRMFDCPETGDTEERPGIGDFAIFWNKEFKDRAVCANLVEMKLGGYQASDKYVYDEAIKFRNYDQYLKVKGIYGED